MGGLVVGLIGGDPIKSIGDLIDQFHLPPEQKVQQAAQELEALAAQDRASARNMHVAVRSVIPPLLGCSVIGAAGVTEFWILTHGIHPRTRSRGGRPNPQRPGCRGAASAQFLLFGSSADSRRKTEILADIMKQQ